MHIYYILFIISCIVYSSRASVASLTKVKPHAVVIGGSLAGLMSATVLSEHFTVTILEKDSSENLLPRESVVERMKSRSGIPQGRHIHVLLAKGAQILEELFPGIQSELVLNGATSVDWPVEYASCIDGRWFARPDGSKNSGINTILCSRPLIESTVRRRTIGNNAIACISDRRCTGLEAIDGSITGVLTRCTRTGINVTLIKRLK